MLVRNVNTVIVVSPLLGVVLLQLAFSSEGYENDMRKVDAGRRRLSHVVVLGVASSFLPHTFFSYNSCHMLGC